MVQIWLQTINEDLLFTDKLMWMARDPTIGRHLVEQVIKICTKSHK